MTIFRSQMGTQIRKPPMKKPVKEKAVGGLLGALSGGGYK